MSDGDFILVLHCTDIFQIDLSRPKKHILIFLFNFTANCKKKRDELTSVKYFTQATVAQMFAKKQFSTLNSNFILKTVFWSNAILILFSRHGLYFHPIKDRCSTRPSAPFFFFTFVVILVKFPAPKASNIFLWKIWDIMN